MARGTINPVDFSGAPGGGGGSFGGGAARPGGLPGGLPRGFPTSGLPRGVPGNNIVPFRPPPAATPGGGRAPLPPPTAPITPPQPATPPSSFRPPVLDVPKPFTPPLVPPPPDPNKPRPAPPTPAEPFGVPAVIYHVTVNWTVTRPGFFGGMFPTNYSQVFAVEAPIYGLNFIKAKSASDYDKLFLDAGNQSIGVWPGAVPPDPNAKVTNYYIPKIQKLGDPPIDLTAPTLTPPPVLVPDRIPQQLPPGIPDPVEPIIVPDVIPQQLPKGVPDREYPEPNQEPQPQPEEPEQPNPEPETPPEDNPKKPPVPLPTPTPQPPPAPEPPPEPKPPEPKPADPEREPETPPLIFPPPTPRPDPRPTPLPTPAPEPPPFPNPNPIPQQVPNPFSNPFSNPNLIPQQVPNPFSNPFPSSPPTPNPNPVPSPGPQTHPQPERPAQTPSQPQPQTPSQPERPGQVPSAVPSAPGAPSPQAPPLANPNPIPTPNPSPNSPPLNLPQPTPPPVPEPDCPCAPAMSCRFQPEPQTTVSVRVFKECVLGFPVFDTMSIKTYTAEAAKTVLMFDRMANIEAQNCIPPDLLPDEGSPAPTTAIAVKTFKSCTKVGSDGTVVEEIDFEEQVLQVPQAEAALYQSLFDRLFDLATAQCDRIDNNQSLKRIYNILGGNTWFGSPRPEGLDPDTPHYNRDLATDLLSLSNLLYDNGEPTASTSWNLIDLVRNSLTPIFYHAGLHQFPATVPQSLLTYSDGQTTSINNVTDLLGWLVKQLDALMGQFPIEIEIEDADPLQEGNQTKKIELPNLSEAIAELYGLAITSSTNSDVAINMLMRLVAEVIGTKNATLITQDYAKANASYLGYKGNPKRREVDYSFDPTKLDTLDQLLKESKGYIQGWEEDDKNSVAEYLQKLMFASGVIKAAFFRDSKLIDNLKKEVEDLATGSKDADDGAWERFKQDLNDPLSPYNVGTDNPQPRIRETPFSPEGDNGSSS